MSQVRPSSSRGRRRAVVGATAAIAVGLTATGALAVPAAPQKAVSVSALSVQGTRQFSVLDGAGTSDLTSLALGTTGGAQPFQIKVVDDRYKAGTGFDVTGEMTNLYHSADGSVAGIDDVANPIPSRRLAVGYGKAPTLEGLGLGVLPQLSVSGLLPTCQDLAGLLPAGSALLGSGSALLSTVLPGTPLGGLGLPAVPDLGDLGLSDLAAPLCAALGTTAKDVDGLLVALQTQVITPVLAALPVGTTLPISLGNGTEAGAFTSPSYAGAGASDPARTGAPAATSRMLLGGAAGTVLPATLDGLVTQALGGLDLTTLASPSALVAALQADATTAPLGTALAGLTSSADLTAVLAALDTLVKTVTGTVLDTLSGTYRSYPQLTGNLAGARPGQYVGTLTVTFVPDAD